MHSLIINFKFVTCNQLKNVHENHIFHDEARTTDGGNVFYETPSTVASEGSRVQQTLNRMTQNSMTQTEIVVAIHSATNGHMWTNIWNLASITDPSKVCDLYGVDCNSNDQIVSINLYKNNIGGTLPTEIAHLTELTYLGLDRNDIGSTIPTDIVRMILCFICFI